MILGSVSIRSGQNAKALGIPVAITVVVVVLIAFTGYYAFSNISKNYNEFKKSQVEESVLQSKSDALSEINTTNLDSSNRSLIAMPQENPGLFMVTQLKTLSQKYSFIETDLKMEKESDFTGDLMRAKIVYVYETENIESIINFFKDIQTLSPLSTIEKIDISRSNLVYSVESEIYVYWSDFPETLPPVSDPIVKLSTSDQEVLTKLSALTIPSFTVLNPAEPVVRTDPF